MLQPMINISVNNAGGIALAMLGIWLGNLT